MDSRENNILYCANEIFVLMSCDMIIIFSDFVPTPTDRYWLGYFYLAIFYISVGVNVFVLGRIIKNKVKDWYANRKNKQQVVGQFNGRVIARQSNLIAQDALLLRA